MKTENRPFGYFLKSISFFFISLVLLSVFSTHTFAGEPVRIWNTFLGSADSDTIRGGVAVDASGNVYVTGHSYATWGTPLNPHAGGNDIILAKYSSAGVLQWHTFMGTAMSERSYGVALDDAGNVYVAGESGATWGTPVNPHTGATDAFVAKLDGNGVLQWNTFMGASDQDYGYGITVDGSGNVYVTGHSYYSWGAPVNPHTGTGSLDAFVAMLDNSGVRQWHTFVGSAETDYCYRVAVDGSGNAYVVGESSAAWGTPVNPHSGDVDAFVAMLNNSGVLLWNTFMGSAGSNDIGWGIAVDDSGSAYVVGYSGATWGTPVNAHAGSYDGFAAKLNNSGTLEWNTFMGSTAGDDAYAVALDGSDNVYVSGISTAEWGTPVIGHAGGDDAFLAVLDSSGTLQWNTFMGSVAEEVGYGVAVDNVGNVFVSGESYATWGTPLIPHSGSGSDGFVVKFNTSDLPDNAIWAYDVGVPHNRLVLPDINADGYDELLLYEDYEQLRVISGADGSTELWNYRLSSDLSRYRRGIEIINDLDDDGIKDIVVVTGTSGNGYDQNVDDDDLYAISGAVTPPGNRVLWFGGEPLHIGYAATGPIVLPDTNGDGYDDIFIQTATPVLSPLRGDYGYHVSGRDGLILWIFQYPAESPIWDIYGRVTAPDLDGDGLGDVVVSGAGGSYGVSAWKGGGTKSMIWQSLSGQEILNPSVLGDLNADGVAEIGVGKFHTACPGTPDYRIEVLDGTNGNLVWEHPLDIAASSIDNLGDVTDDETEDIVIGTYYHNACGGPVYGVYALDGDPNATIRVIWFYDMIDQNSYVKVIEDINSDGKKDVAVTGGHSKVIILSGADGASLCEENFSSATGFAQLGEFNNQAGDEILTSTGNEVIALTVSATVGGNDPPAGPVSLSPANEAVFGGGATITLKSSAFSDPNGDPHLQTQWTVMRADTDEVVYEVISQSDLTEHTITDTLDPGLRYVWRVRYEDDQENTSIWSAEFSFKIGDPESEVLPAVASGTDVGDFGMISIVHWPNDPSPEAVFNIDYDPANYRIGTYDVLTGSYVEFGEGLEMEPGRSYWILAREGLVVNFNGIPVSLTAEVYVALDYNTGTANGWNMVAPPNDADYYWGDVEVVVDISGTLTGVGTVQSLADDNPYIDRRLWRWENGSYTSDTPDTDPVLKMEAYAGYWVRARQAGVFLRFDPGTQLSSLSQPDTLVAKAWRKALNWLNNLNLFSKEAIADNDTPPMPMAALDDNTVDPVFQGCFIETADDFNQF